MRHNEKGINAARYHLLILSGINTMEVFTCPLILSGRINIPITSTSQVTYVKHFLNIVLTRKNINLLTFQAEKRLVSLEVLTWLLCLEENVSDREGHLALLHNTSSQECIFLLTCKDKSPSSFLYIEVG